MAQKTLENNPLEAGIRPKKLFYILRPLLAFGWVATRRSMPPTEFEALLGADRDRLTDPGDPDAKTDAGRSGTDPGPTASGQLDRGDPSPGGNGGRNPAGARQPGHRGAQRPNAHPGRRNVGFRGQGEIQIS